MTCWNKHELRMLKKDTEIAIIIFVGANYRALRRLFLNTLERTKPVGEVSRRFVCALSLDLERISCATIKLSGRGFSVVTTGGWIRSSWNFRRGTNAKRGVFDRMMTQVATFVFLARDAEDTNPLSSEFDRYVFSPYTMGRVFVTWLVKRSAIREMYQSSAPCMYGFHAENPSLNLSAWSVHITLWAWARTAWARGLGWGWMWL